jgi:hypothetical protein
MQFPQPLYSNHNRAKNSLKIVDYLLKANNYK